jgi:hypothetical protein
MNAPCDNNHISHKNYLLLAPPPPAGLADGDGLGAGLGAGLACW